MQDISNLPKDTLVEGNRIVKKIGTGYTGIVYRAFDDAKRRDVALKFLKKPEKEYDRIAQRFKNEYQRQLIGKVHPNIAEVYQFGSLEGQLFFTSEFADGYNIFVASRGLSVEDKLKLLIQVLEGLDFIHCSGLLHLDIKAENVIVKSGRVKIVDFGLAAALGGEITIGGTPQYIAPEMAAKLRDKIDARADLFSAAVLMYHCLTGTFPFSDRWGASSLQSASEIIASEKPAEPLSAMRSELPEYLDTVIMRLLKREPSERFYPNARAVINALLTHQPDAFEAGASRRQLAPYFQPIGDKWIGRTVVMEKLNTAVQGIVIARSGSDEAIQRTPTLGRPTSVGGIFHISGKFGVGKSHLLNKLREDASLHPESIYISSISFPADDATIERWSANLQRELSENQRTILVLADDVQSSVIASEAKQSPELLNLITTITNRLKNPKLCEGLKPVLLVMASEPQDLSKDEPSLHKTWNLAPETWNHIAQFELEPLTREEVEEYLNSTPALKGKKIPSKWLDHIYWMTSGCPRELTVQLNELDSARALFNLDGQIIVPQVEEPSINVTNWHNLPMPTKERLQKQYKKLEPVEREVVNFLAVWDHRHLTRPVAEDDIADFFYSPSIRQVLSNLMDKNVIARGKAPKQSSELTFTHPYMQSVIYDRLHQEDREVIHDSIAGYLKKDKEGILLHTGYGSFSQSAVIASGAKQSPAINLVTLAQNKLFKSGEAQLAASLLEDALHKCTDNKLKINISELLLEAYYYAGRYKDAENLYDERRDISLATKFIPSLISQKRYDEANSLIDGRKAKSEALKNFKASILYKRSYDESAQSRKLLLKAKNIFEENLKGREQAKNNELGQVLAALGELDASLKHLEEKRVESKDENIFTYFTTLLAIAEVQRLSKNYDQALKTGNEVLKIAKLARQKNWLVYVRNILANIYHDSGRYDEAITEYTSCIAASPPPDIENIVYVCLGSCYQAKNDLDKAELYFETVIGRKTDGVHLISACLGLSEVYLARKLFDKAAQQLAKIETLLSNLPDSIAVPFKDKISELRKKLS